MTSSGSTDRSGFLLEDKRINDPTILRQRRHHDLPRRSARRAPAVARDIGGLRGYGPALWNRLYGKEWDHGVPGAEYWQAIARVCKPGASLLAFGGTRTYHRLTCAIEDAGLEIRDCLMWLHGQGFPKSLDISKALDKAAGAVREVVGASRSIDCVERGYTKVYSTKAENSGFGTSRTFGLGIPITAPGHAGGCELERLGHGPETRLGANRPGHEATGRHVCPQCRDVGRGRA